MSHCLSELALQPAVHVLWGSLEDSLAVIAACTGHPTLRALDFKHNRLNGAPGRGEIEAALEALESSNAELSVTRY